MTSFQGRKLSPHQAQGLTGAPAYEIAPDGPFEEFLGDGYDDRLSLTLRYVQIIDTVGPAVEFLSLGMNLFCQLRLSWWICTTG